MLNALVLWERLPTCRWSFRDLRESFLSKTVSASCKHAGAALPKNHGCANPNIAMPTNVLGTELRCCCRDPMTGFYRDGYCRTGPEDVGLHTVCVEVTEEFLDFSVLDGNDLVTPMPEWGFPGFKPGDRWCVCVTRWKAALERGRAAPIDLEATHSSALEFVDLEDLKAHAVQAVDSELVLAPFSFAS